MSIPNLILFIIKFLYFDPSFTYPSIYVSDRIFLYLIIYLSTDLHIYLAQDMYDDDDYKPNRSLFNTKKRGRKAKVSFLLKGLISVCNSLTF